MSSAGRVVVVTGASRGIGLAIASKFRSLGDTVAIVSRSIERANEAADPIGAHGFGANVTDGDASRRCVDEIVERFGRIDVLVNNAGTNPAYGRLVDLDHGQVSKTFDTNVWGPVLWSGLAWHASMREHGGVIINNTSIGAFVVGSDIAVYHASKAALVHLTKHLALELAPGVRVNAVAPGLIRTRMSEALWEHGSDSGVLGLTPLGRHGRPEDVANAVAFLASDEADWMTGETIVVDGGQLLGPAQEA